MKTKIFLNTYTVQKEWDDDPLRTLEFFHEAGYEGIEMQINCDQPLFDKILLKINSLGLNAVSAHINFTDALERSDFYFNRMSALNIKNMVIPWLPEDCLPGGVHYSETKEKITALAELCKKNSASLAYHNHDFEFKKINGVCKYDIFLQDISVLDAQLDICWCAVGGQNPAEYIRHYGHRMKTMHLKDFSLSRQVEGVKLFDLLGQGDAAEAQVKRKENGFAFRPIGMGKVDFVSIFKAADETGICWAGVEQDESPDMPPMEAAKLSIDYIRKNWK